MDYFMLLISIGLGIAIPCLCGFLVLFYVFPNYMVKIFLMLRERSAGMKIKYVGDEDFVFCYGEKNKPQPDKTSILFVHGFTSSKDQWITCFKSLDPDLHMMALDLPGHGGSTIPGSEVKTDIEYVMGKLNKFLDLVGFSDRKVHIAGSSLGGAISGIFAAHHPERVEKVSIICPPMETPVNSAFLKELKQAMALEPESLTFEHCSLLPQDLESTKKMFDLCTYNKVSDKLNDQIWKGFLLLRLNRNDFNLRMFKNLANYDYLNLLTSLAPEIKVPSQLIWGQDDAVTHMSGAEVLQSKLPNCRHVDILEQCGHAIDIDRPGALCKALSKFIKEDVDASSEVTTLRSSWKKEDKKGK